MSLSIPYSIYIKTAFGCTASLLLLTGAALAKTQTESFTTIAPLKCSQNANNFVLPSFETTLGTLESVDITLTFASCSRIRVFNDGCTPQSFTDASMTMPITLDGPAGLDINTSLTASLASGLAKPGLNSFCTTKSSTTDTQQINPGSFNLWENQPNDKVSFTLSKGNPTYQGTDHGNDLFFGGKARERGKITVQYTYCPGTGKQAVPEPSGKYLSGIVAAAMMLMLIGRRKLLRA